MQEPINIHDELKIIAPGLISISRENPHFVPEHYFDNLALELLNKAGIENNRTGRVPEGYFDQLPNALLGRIKAMEAHEELAEIAPTLMGISKKMPHYLPAGYFENLGVQIPTEAPVIQLPTSRNKQLIPTRMRWAVAASLIALAGLLTWQVFFKPTTSTEPVIATNTSNNTDSTAIYELAAALSALEDQSLVNELGDDAASETRSALYYYNTNNFENALKELSDAELGQYLLDQPIPSQQPS